MITVQLSVNEYLDFLKNVKERELWMYVSLLSLSSGGKCTKTQVEIGRILGIHPTTVYKRIKELNKVYVKGRRLVRTVRRGETNVYYLLQLDQLHKNEKET